ncbi:MAG: 30S ribosomal protein S17 [uncultured bacterium]|nr:MAG: 30S ribosomal protein S17 [uncultured bacterium]
MTKTSKIKRVLKGVVVSDKMDKTVVVKVERIKVHAKYHKRFKISKKFKAHDAKNVYKIGDVVKIQEVRPLSRDKRWLVIKKY